MHKISADQVIGLKAPAPLLWKIRFPRGQRSRPFCSSETEKIFVEPPYSKEGADKPVVVLKAKDGQVDQAITDLFKANFKPIFKTEHPFPYAMDDQNLYVLADDNGPSNGELSGSMYAFDLKSGTQRWAVSLGNRNYAKMPLEGKKLLFIWAFGQIIALDKKAGTVNWHRFLPIARDVQGVATARDMVFVTNTFGNLFALSAQDGTIRWKYSVEPLPIHSAPVVWNQSVGFGSRTQRFTALDARTGRLQWQTHFETYLDTQPVVGSNNVIYLTLQKPRVVCALDGNTGKILWRNRLAKRLDSDASISYLTSPAVAVPDEQSRKDGAGDMVYFADDGGMVYACRGRDGHIVWTYDTKERCYALIIGGDNFLFVPTDNANLWAFRR